ncbi:polyketide cyclase / dehydrase and lipid transport [Methyloglobulus morosus KoM1]|uniref:Polyketide cyclase / dehydrase and lipid transport n=1 Tax=Methyloglobulus morosus KoM1 TaxID=1116472 RepID=V5C8T1_9GAMM|nr:SRPBCC family protein [Methyloglobulus morosus]ESS73118.1 polyketide cyclase / dehydrase and lipid transport [Methyloglobulus morosus KoM1]
MMTLLIALAVLVAAVLVFVAAKPNEFQIQRNIIIKAPSDKIFPLINDLHLMQTWSAWEKVDPDMQRSYSGEASGKGAKYAWEGNKEIGQGTMEIIESTPNTKIGLHMHFIKPFEGRSSIDFTLAANSDETVVAQTMRGTSTFLPKLMCTLFFNQDKMIGGKFEEGLANLKAIAEK